MNDEALASRVKQAAASSGFDACAIAAARPVDPADRFVRWIRRGFHAGMDWLAKSLDIRLDIRRKLPGARSVVVVARNYHGPRPRPAPGSLRVARYAWGRDYHRVLKGPLEKVRACLDALEPGAKSYASIDSGPVLEKFWAARAGLGWIGKNSLVVRPGLGSWFFLGVAATTVELPPDPPMPDQCGACTACIDACPTGAIVEPGVVDARRCISYQTVENRGPIAEGVAARLGDWVFGCDVCQEVCPWNSAAPETTEHAFHPIPGHANPRPETLLDLTEQAFHEEFAGTVLMRPGLVGMKRNIEAVLRNRDAHPRCGPVPADERVRASETENPPSD